MTAIFDSYSLYPVNRLKHLRLPDVVTDFLSQVGLPDWVAPNIHFGEDEDEWLPQHPQIETLIILGSDRDDNPICIDKRNGAIFRVEDGSCDFFASSVFMLSKALEKFQVAVDHAIEEDSEAFTNQRIPAQALEPFIQWLLLYEPRAMETGAFWHSVLQWLSSETLTTLVSRAR